jgi:hypothetical protein
LNLRKSKDGAQWPHRHDLIGQLIHPEGNVMQRIAILLVIVLAGCAATVNRTRTADGRNGATISCNGLTATWKKCDRAAAKVCPGGFDVIDRQEKKTYTDTGSFMSRTLVVSCKP